MESCLVSGESPNSDRFFASSLVDRGGAESIRDSVAWPSSRSNDRSFTVTLLLSAVACRGGREFGPEESKILDSSVETVQGARDNTLNVSS